MGIAPGVGRHEQRRVRDDRGPGAQALRHGLRLRVRGRRTRRTRPTSRRSRAPAEPTGSRSSTRISWQPALRAACGSGRPTVIDVPMRNTPVMTPGEWDIERIYQAAQTARRHRSGHGPDGRRPGRAGGQDGAMTKAHEGSARQASRRHRGRRPSRRPPTGRSSCAAWPSTTPSVGRRSRRCSCGCGAVDAATDDEAT